MPLHGRTDFSSVSLESQQTRLKLSPQPLEIPFEREKQLKIQRVRTKISRPCKVRLETTSALQRDALFCETDEERKLRLELDRARHALYRSMQSRELNDKHRLAVRERYRNYFGSIQNTSTSETAANLPSKETRTEDKEEEEDRDIPVPEIVTIKMEVKENSEDEEKVEEDRGDLLTHQIKAEPIDFVPDNEMKLEPDDRAVEDEDDESTALYFENLPVQVKIEETETTNDTDDPLSLDRVFIETYKGVLVDSTGQKIAQIEERQYRCNTCSRVFSNLDTLRFHEEFHVGTKSLKSTFKTHNRSDDKSAKKYKCNMCSNSFTDRDNYKKHKRFHYVEKSYECDICLKEFSHRSKLREHERIHTSEKPYQCDICFKAFRLSATLKNHKLIHTGERPYKCNICFRAFRMIGSLRKHNKINTCSKYVPYLTEVAGVPT